MGLVRGEVLYTGAKGKGRGDELDLECVNFKEVKEPIRRVCIHLKRLRIQ